MTADDSNKAIPPPTVSDRPIVTWLVLCCLMVVAMMLIGAVTRLTESGLSMVEWRPLIGVLPPLDEAEWGRIFDLYRATSEYRLENAGMTIGEFKTIFWWEYIHRLWGRLIGLVFGLPFLWFLVRRKVPAGLTPHLIALFVLGGLQGVIGWWMVKSGLVDRHDVSQYRLVVHLAIAFLILGYMLWLVLGRVSPSALPANDAARRWAAAVVFIVGVTILSGGLVAGTGAGFDFNTWPLMDGGFVPEDMFDLSPWWLSLFESVPTIQFDHRILAYATILSIACLWVAARRGNAPVPRRRRATTCLVVIALAQAGLGITTLLLVVPPTLGILHQAGAIAIFSAAVWTLHTCRRGRS